MSTLLAWSACPSLTSPAQHRDPGAFVMIPECVTPLPLRIKEKEGGGGTRRQRASRKGEPGSRAKTSSPPSAFLSLPSDNLRLVPCPGSTLHIFSQEPFQQYPKLSLFPHSPGVSLPHRSESSTPVPSTPLVKSIGFADPVANPNSAMWLLRSSPDRFVAKSSNDAAQTQSSHARNDSSYYLKRKAPDSSAWL